MSEELVDAADGVDGGTCADGLERCANFLERFELREELNIAQRAISGDEISNTIHLFEERIDSDFSGGGAARERVVSIPLLEYGADDSV